MSTGLWQETIKSDILKYQQKNYQLDLFFDINLNIKIILDVKITGSFNHQQQ